MRKIVFKSFILTFFLLSMSLSAQIRYGIKGSIQRTNVSKIHMSSKGRTAAAIGGFLQIPIGYDNQYFFQPEIEYSLQGESDDLGGINKKTKYFQNYVNIPIMFRAYFSEDDNEFFGELGPMISYLVYEKSKELDLQNYSKVDDIDFSIGVGVGFSILRKYDFSIRYNYGLTDIYKDYPEPQKTSRLALTFAYTIN